MQHDPRRFFDVSPDLICVTDAEGHIVRVNPSFRQTLAWPEADLSGQSFIDLTHPNDVERTTASVSGLVSRDSTTTVAGRFRRGDGEYVRLLWLVFRDPDAGLRYHVARKGEPLRHPDDRFRHAFEEAPVAMILVDRHGAIVLANQEVEGLFGYDRQELVGERVEMLIPKTLRAEHSQFRDTFLVHGQRRPMGFGRDLSALHKNGSEFPVEIGLIPIEIDGGTFVLSSIVDLTARKEAEHAQAQLIEELQSALSEIRTLRGLIPICAGCKSIRNDEGYWQSLESYLGQHGDAELSHFICPECGPKMYGELWQDPSSSKERPRDTGP